jgi:Na+-translocating ferredoxin:NAD+ oxidoreductase RnfG subunit
MCSSFAEDLITTDEALRKIFSQATHFDSRGFALSDEQIKAVEEKAQVTFEGSHSTDIQLYTAEKDGQTLGFVFEDRVIGKWGPIHYLLGLDPQGTVLDVVILDYQEIRGRPIAKKRFLRQYQKKSIHDSVRLRKDIDGVTGATISSRSLTDGIRKLLNVFEELGMNKSNAM